MSKNENIKYGCLCDGVVTFIAKAIIIDKKYNI